MNYKKNSIVKFATNKSFINVGNLIYLELDGNNANYKN